MLKDKSQIPKFLIGKYRNVSRRVRNITKKVMKSGTWMTVLEDAEGVSLDSIPNKIVTDCSFVGSKNMEVENVVVCTLGDNMINIGGVMPDRGEWYATAAKLTDEGLDYLWFTMCLVSSGLPALPYMGSSPVPDELSQPLLARKFLRKILRWSEELDLHRPRCIHCNGAAENNFGVHAFSVFLMEIGMDHRWTEIRDLTWVDRRAVITGWLNDG
jgi:hypothetical protein